MSQRTRLFGRKTVSVTPRTAAACVGVVAFALYLLTMNPGPGFVDKGEMAAAACTLGVPHPTGYPTLMLAGFAWSKLFGVIGVRPILSLNILNALLSAMSVGVLCLLFTHIMRRAATHTAFTEPEPAADKTPAQQPAGITLCAALAALTTGTTGMWWSQATGFEVYGLHQFFIALLSLLFLRYVDRQADSTAEPRIADRGGALFALALGLSFTNHLTTVLLAPAFLTYYFLRLGLGAATWKRILFMTPFFLAGLLPYLLLPVAAAQLPWVNWGVPDTLPRFLEHVSGHDYQSRLFARGAALRIFGQQTRYFFAALLTQFGYLGLVPLALGVPALLRARRSGLMMWTGMLALTGFLYGTNYNAFDADGYFLTCILALGVLLCSGLLWLHARIGSAPAIAVAAACLAATVACNYQNCDEHGNRIVQDLTDNVLRSMPRNAIVITGQWNYWTSASLYMQAVEKRRPDIIVINRNLMDDGWYWKTLEHYHPDIVQPVRPQLDAFLAQEAAGKAGAQNDSLLSLRFTALARAFVATQITRRPVCVTTDIEPELVQDYTRVPFGFGFLLRTTAQEYVPQAFPDYRYREWSHTADPYNIKLLEVYFVCIANRAMYEAEHGNSDLARRYAAYALQFYPKAGVNHLGVLPLNLEDLVGYALTSCADMKTRLNAILSQSGQ